MWSDVILVLEPGKLEHALRRLDPGLPGAGFRGPARLDLSLRAGLREHDPDELLAGALEPSPGWRRQRRSASSWRRRGELAGSGTCEGVAHITEPSNAHRSLLVGLENLQWDAALLDLFGLPAALLPEIGPSDDPGVQTLADPGALALVEIEIEAAGQRGCRHAVDPPLALPVTLSSYAPLAERPTTLAERFLHAWSSSSRYRTLQTARAWTAAPPLEADTVRIPAAK